MIVYSVATQGHADFEGRGKTNSVPPPSSLYLGHRRLVFNQQKYVFSILIRKLPLLIPEKIHPGLAKTTWRKKTSRNAHQFGHSVQRADTQRHIHSHSLKSEPCSS